MAAKVSVSRRAHPCSARLPPMASLVTITGPLSIREIEESDSLALGYSHRLPTGEESRHVNGVGALLADASSVDRLELGSLRHVLATRSFASDVMRLQRQLARPELVTNNGQASAVGKSLSWLASATGRTVSVVVLDYDWYLGMIEGQSLARGIFYHELAHVHDNVQRQQNRVDVSHPDARDLTAVERFIALSLGAEYFAERVASRQYSEDDLEAFVGNADSVGSFLADVQREKDAYRDHADLLRFWQQAVRTVGLCADMIGRSVGEFHRSEHRHLFERFVSRLGRPKWATAIDAVGEALQDLPTAGLDPSPTLVATVRGMFHAIGVFPRVEAGGQLYVDVP